MSDEDAASDPRGSGWIRLEPVREPPGLGLIFAVGALGVLAVVTLLGLTVLGDGEPVPTPQPVPTVSVTATVTEAPIVEEDAP